MRRKVAKELVAAITKKLFDNEAECDAEDGTLSFGGVELSVYPPADWSVFVDNFRVRLPWLQQRRLNCAVQTYLLIRAKAALGDSGGQDTA